MRRRLAPAAAAGGALAAAAPASAHGNSVPVSELAGSWHADPVVLVIAGLALALFLQAFVRLRLRGRRDHAGWDRLALFAAGVSLAVLPVLSPLDAIADEYLLSGHMLEHLLLGDAGVALAIVAVRGPLVFFLLPPFLLRPLARLAWLRTGLRALLRPRVALAAWAVVMAVWHVPALYDYALTHRAVHDVQHASFVVAGTLIWIQLVDPARRATLSVARRIGFAAVVFAFGQVLSDVLIFSFHPLYPAYAAQDERLLGLSPLLDQQLAGVVMMVEQALSLGTCAALLLLGHRRLAARRTRAGLAEAT